MDAMAEVSTMSNKRLGRIGESVGIDTNCSFASPKEGVSGNLLVLEGRLLFCGESID